MIGVPQDTTLGPLHFIVYNNDLYSRFEKHAIVAYADDTVVISIGNTWDQQVKKLILINYIITGL